MAEARIPLDPTNPGQVFACLGLMEAAEVLLGDVSGGFALGAPETFTLRAAGDADPVTEVLRFLLDCEVRVFSPAGADESYGKDSVFAHHPAYPEGTYPCGDTAARDRFPAVLVRGCEVIVLDHWADAARGDAMKFWAGAGGYPGVALARDALALLPRRIEVLRDDPFNAPAAQSSSFRFDWRRDYVPVDAGFSPNRHGRIVMVGYPVVEILAAIGLRHARPERQDRLHYRYAVWGVPLDLPLARAALGAPDPLWPGMPRRRFRMTLDWPGQEGQAKCITRVDEETPT
jgi:CRISPR-associated protein Csx14